VSDVIESVARAIHLDAYPQGEWEHVKPEVQVKTRAVARTICSARLCKQTPLLAAKRLAMWADVDARKPFRPYEEHPASERAKYERAARAGFAALGWSQSTE
jgi:hypothetical protein